MNPVEYSCVLHISRVEYSFCHHRRQGTHVIPRPIDNRAVNFAALLSMDLDTTESCSLRYSRCLGDSTISQNSVKTNLPLLILTSSSRFM